VGISASYLLTNQGFKKVRIDSSLLLPRINNDLSTILAQNSTIYINSYGIGGPATASFRGTSSSHTQVEWNGIKINSPMLGQMDLSQVPVSKFDGIEILYGAAGIAETSGAFGGVINLVSSPDWNNKISLLVAPTIASFSTYNFNANFAAGSSTFQSLTKMNYCNSVNDFPYYDNSYQVRDQKNASFNTYGLTQEFFFRIKKKDFLSAKVWYNYDFRNIPPNITDTDSTHFENQKEKTLRSLVEWKRFEKKFSFTLRSGFVDQFTNYKLDSLNAVHQYYSWVNRLKFLYSGIKKLKIRPGLDFNYDRVESDNYNGIKTRSTMGLFSEFNYEVNKKIQLTLVLREEYVDTKFLPLIPALGIDYKPFNKIDFTLSANFSRNYKNPSLNDLYWSLSGNPDLKSETDYAAEMSALYHFRNKKENFLLETELTVIIF
jgi:outer membrane cobalamin receptor